MKPFMFLKYNNMNELKELKRWVDEELKLLWYEHQQIIAKIEELENNK